MADASARKLPKAARRDQLPKTAQMIVREQGTDALTLGYLAERADVSKPVAYEHFRSRSGLLIALYRQIDDQRAAASGRHSTAPRRQEDVARVASDASMNCYGSIGPEWHAISAALKGDEEMDAFQQDLIDGYVALYRDALAPYTDLPERERHLRCVGIIGAAEAISRDLIRGRTDETTAAAMLASLIADWLSADAPQQAD